MEGCSYSDITIRPMDISDVDDFFEWHDEKVTEFCPLEAFTSKEAAIEYFIDNVICHPWHKAICLSGRPVGAISVTPFHGADKCRTNIGYILGSVYWGKGIATRAVKMAANIVFLEWEHLERLEALTDVENLRLQRVLEKAGFTREGVLKKHYLLEGKVRDDVMFSLLSTDPHVNYFMDS